MKRLVSSLACALLVCLAWIPAQAEILYDGFNGSRINPAKWIATPVCEDPYAHDCVREVRLGHLRLAVRKSGDPSSDVGEAAADSGLQFRSPEAIEGIGLRFRITSFAHEACPSNDLAAHPQLLVFGTFFNSGNGGNPDEDVIAYLAMERRTDDDVTPATSLRIIGFMSQGPTFFNNVDLGTVKVGEPAVVSLNWDRENQLVVWRAIRTFTKPYVVAVAMPSLQGAGNAPVDPTKSLLVRAFAPSCTTLESSSAMDALIDAVWARVADPHGH